VVLRRQGVRLELSGLREAMGSARPVASSSEEGPPSRNAVAECRLDKRIRMCTRCLS
jgi:hypothetical protein